MTPQKGFSLLIQRLCSTSLFSSWVRLVALSLLLGLGLLAGDLLTSKPVHAQPLTSTTITDCSSDSQLQNAISSASSGDTITFGCSGDIKLSKTLTIATNLTLDGNGQNVTLDGGNSMQVLNMNSGVSFTLNDITLAHGGPNSTSRGGGLFDNGGSLIISNSTFAGNTAISGAGLFATGGTVSISNSTFFANNSTFSGGGGILNQGATISITNSTFANNTTSVHCDGVGGGGILNSGSLSISNSTFVNNSGGCGPQGVGGGLVNDGGSVIISNSTFANNTASGLGPNSGGGIYGVVNISNSIVADNSNGDCAGGVKDQGYNLSSDSSCGFTGTGSLQNTDPRLDSNGLQNNGGPTQTIALLSGSPASDVIPSTSCPATDQRGVSRPDNGETTCDMGAYEFVDPVDKDLSLTNMPATITTDATSPQGAVVTYTSPTVVDQDSPLPPVSCSPASGSTFAIGTTTVTCTVSDSDDTNSPVSGSFQVVVNGAATQISNLITTVNGFHFKKAIQVTLDAELQTALNAVNQGKTRVACAALDVFNGEVKLLTGHGITSSQAAQLIAATTQIKAVLGC